MLAAISESPTIRPVLAGKRYAVTRELVTRIDLSPHGALRVR